MREHHQKTIENLVQTFKNDERFPAIIIYGSIAKGHESEDTDVDMYLVATSEEFEKRKAEKNYRYVTDSRDICVSPCTYVDGKVVDLNFLIDTAERGSEPMRASFLGAFIAYSRIQGLEEIIKRIPVYQEHERLEKMKSFYTMCIVFHWYISEAEKRNDRYLLIRSAAEFVFFGGRLILAYNRILYPYHKWFMRQLKTAPEKPDNIIQLAEDLLGRPCKENGKLFYDCIMNYTDWEKILGRFEPFDRFIDDVEWSWLAVKPAIYDW